MEHFEITIRVPRGSVLIGGYSATGSTYDVSHASRNGQPIIPATALRGALRETYEALLRGADLGEVCTSSGTSEPRPCECEVCSVFGTGRTALADGLVSPLLLEDACLLDRPFVWQTREGVSIDRRRRSAEDGLLFNRRVPGANGSLDFVARGRWLVKEEVKNRLKNVVAATTHIGSGRSRGLGRVEMNLEWTAAPQPGEPPKVTSSDLSLRVELLAPTSVGVPLPRDNMRETRREIPGSAVRGMFGWALAEAGEKNLDALFGTSDADGAHFGFLYPGVPGAGGLGAFPLPLTARWCKREKRRHGVADSLFDRIAQRVLQRQGVAGLELAKGVHAQALGTCSHKPCADRDGSLATASGARSGSVELPTRIVTRLAMERQHSSAREGALFSHEMIDPTMKHDGPVVFSGSVRGIQPESFGLVSKALTLPLSLGRGRAHGWGRVKVSVESLPESSSVRDRGDAFTDALTTHLEACQLDATLAERLVPITLLSPLLIPDTQSEGEDGATVLAAALGVEIDWFLRIRRFGVEVGWNQQKNQRPARQSVVAGSIFVAEVRDWEAAVAALEQLEHTGCGDRTNQGYGRVLAFDPFALERTFVPNEKEEKKVTDTKKDTPREPAVQAAEKVVAWAKDTHHLGKVEKNQVSKLVSITQEATCAAEIANWLRYQVGRGHWPTELGKRVIDDVEALGKKLGTEDQARIDAWRWFALYFMRAYTYHRAVERGAEETR